MRYRFPAVEEVRDIELRDSERTVLLRLLRDENDRLVNIMKMRDGINNDIAKDEILFNDQLIRKLL